MASHRRSIWPAIRWWPVSGQALVHSAGPVEGGWGVIDFWESREAFDAFVADRLMPRLQGLGDKGFPSPPDVKQFEVHNLQTA